MVKHGDTLSLEIILLKLWVSIGAHRNESHVGYQVDGMIAWPHRWEPPKLSKDVTEGVQEPVEHGRLVAMEGVQASLGLDIVLG